MMNLLEIKSLIEKVSGLPAKEVEDSTGRISVFVSESGERRTLLNYLRLDERKNIISGYLTTQTWWKNKISENNKSFFDKKIVVKQKDGINIRDIDMSDFKRYLTAYFNENESLQILQATSKNKDTLNKKKKNNGLSLSQSKAVKELNNYVCDSCKVDFSAQDDKAKNKLLQVHHKIRNINGNRDHISNLSTLCTICHGEQEGKGHHFQRENKIHHELIKRLRNEQGI